MRAPPSRPPEHPGAPHGTHEDSPTPTAHDVEERPINHPSDPAFMDETLRRNGPPQSAVASVHLGVHLGFEIEDSRPSDNTFETSARYPSSPQRAMRFRWGYSDGSHGPRGWSLGSATSGDGAEFTDFQEALRYAEKVNAAAVSAHQGVEQERTLSTTTDPTT